MCELICELICEPRAMKLVLPERSVRPGGRTAGGPAAGRLGGGGDGRGAGRPAPPPPNPLPSAGRPDGSAGRPTQRGQTQKKQIRADPTGSGRIRTVRPPSRAVRAAGCDRQGRGFAAQGSRVSEEYPRLRIRELLWLLLYIAYIRPSSLIPSPSHPPQYSLIPYPPQYNPIPHTHGPHPNMVRFPIPLQYIPIPHSPYIPVHAPSGVADREVGGV